MKTIGVLEKIEEMHKIRKIIFFNAYKMPKISVIKFSNAKVYTITIDNKKYYFG